MGPRGVRLALLLSLALLAARAAAAGSVEEVSQQITRIYEAHNPAKLEAVPGRDANSRGPGGSPGPLAPRFLRDLTHFPWVH
jgi:hypothetical protein